MEIKITMENNKLNVLVFGSGAREQAIAESISRSPLLNKLFLADAGYEKLGEVIKYTDFEDLALKSVKAGINLVVIGPSEPLCEGIVDVFKAQNIACIGVNKGFSQLEGSRLFAKNFMKKYDIKTAKFEVITKEALPDYDRLKYPLVIKADGICDGNGVVTANNQSFAQKTIGEFLDGKFGENSKTILLEECLQGEEISLVSLWDGKNILHFAPARGFKKLNKSLSAPNTEGMGACCPVKFNPFQQKKLDEYKSKLKSALTAEGANFCGFISSNLIMSQKDKNWDWNVLSLNVSMGDPQAQAVLAHLETDFLKVLKAATDKNLDKIKLEYNEDYSACLVVACEGYPKSREFQKIGKKIYIPEDIESLDIKVFYSAVKEVKGELYSDGGRVLFLCTTSQDPFWDLKNFAKEIEMENKYFRTDMEVR